MSLNDMTPRNTPNDCADLRLLQSEQCGDLPMQEFATGGVLPNTPHIIGGDLCLLRPLPSTMAILGHHVSGVSGRRPNEEVQRIEAIPNVAGMKHIEVVRNVTDNMFVNEAMHQHRLVFSIPIKAIAKMNQPVTRVGDAGRAQQAASPLPADRFSGRLDNSFCHLRCHVIIVYQNGGKNL